MIKEKQFLTPIIPNPPAPHHTEIKPKCFTCKHFFVCQLKKDYLKTAQLIQNVLGNPCESLMITLPPFKIRDFEGNLVIKPEDYFPTSVYSTTEKEGIFYAAKYIDSNHFSFVYIFEGYYVLFNAVYNSETKEFNISAGKEVCYGLECTIAKDLDLLQIGLITLKDDLEKPEEKEEKDEDIINTTYFSAALNCDFYEWEKGLSYVDGVKRILRVFPCGVPIGENEIYHLATFHKEPGQVPYYHPENGVPVLAPMPFPVMIPPKCKHDCCPPKIKRRDELNEY